MNRSRISIFAAIPLLTIAAAAAIAPLPAQEQPVPRANYGPLELRGYELREHQFDPPFRALRADGTVELKTFGWQIVIKGSNFPTRALDPILWVDDVALIRYERCIGEDGSSLVYSFFDPTLLRSEHVLQVIYGKDERTRTKLLERLDPERLEKLPDAQRRALGFPEYEGLVLSTVGANGHIEGSGRLASGTIRVAARSETGSFRAMAGAAGTVKLGGDGKFAADIGAWPKGTTHVAMLLVPAGTQLAEGELASLPKGVELLDMKPLGTAPAAH